MLQTKGKDTDHLAELASNRDWRELRFVVMLGALLAASAIASGVLYSGYTLVHREQTDNNARLKLLQDNLTVHLAYIDYRMAAALSKEYSTDPNVGAIVVSDKFGTEVFGAAGGFAQ